MNKLNPCDYSNKNLINENYNRKILSIIDNFPQNKIGFIIKIIPEYIDYIDLNLYETLITKLIYIKEDEDSISIYRINKF